MDGIFFCARKTQPYGRNLLLCKKNTALWTESSSVQEKPGLIDTMPLTKARYSALLDDSRYFTGVNSFENIDNIK
jgi:hypothetical protein